MKVTYDIHCVESFEIVVMVREQNFNTIWTQQMSWTKKIHSKMSWMEEKNCDYADEMTGKNKRIVNIS